MATITPNREDVKVIQSMVDTMVGITKFSYPARQAGRGLDQPRPSDEFAHIRIIEEYQESIPAQYIHEQDDNTTTLRTYGLNRIRARIGVVETSGIPSMKIMNGWNSEAIKAIMLDTGYGFIRCTPLSSEDAKLEKEWEYRKGFSVDLYVTRIYEEVVDNINHVVISGGYIIENAESLEEISLNVNV